MRCTCCNKQLNDEEATARFVDDDPAAPPRYVEMCKHCRSFLPKEIKLKLRHDLQGKTEELDIEDEFDLGEYDDEDRWN